MKLRILFSLLFSFVAAFAAKKDALPLVDVFVAGQGYPFFRIPSLVTAKSGALLAFAEGRTRLADQSGNDLVLKRSLDGGNTWGELQCIAEDGDHSLNNPTAIVLRDSGRVLLIYQRYAQGFGETKALPGYSGVGICRSFVIQSDDEGVTWSAPREITAGVKRPTEATSTASGPGIGIQLRHGEHAGRVIIPFNQGPAGKWQVYAAISDDEGGTWNYGVSAGEMKEGHANEVQMAELADGTIILNARNEGGAPLRKTARSRDGGETWSALAEATNLPDPHCQGSLLQVTAAGQEALLFCNPAETSSRSGGKLRVSLDGGESWPKSKVIYPGSFAYSCLTPLGTDAVGCVFERDGYKKITFTRVPFSVLGL